MSAVETALMDIKCLKRVLYSCVKCKSFTGVYIFSFMRDTCTVIEEIKSSFEQTNDLDIDKNIKKIRQNTKIFGKRGSSGNQEVYMKIRNIHEESFEEWENNIGFYLSGREVAGSTLYSTYMFYGSIFENPYKLSSDVELQNSYNNFVTKSIPHALVNLEIVLSENSEIKEPNLVKINNEPLRCFDVRAEIFFNDKEKTLTYQSMVFRLALSLQELNYVIFIYSNFINKVHNEFIDQYYFVRILTKNTDTVLKNLKNISKYQTDDFNKWLQALKDDNLRSEILELVEESYHSKWINKMRNMIHYDTDSNDLTSNFLGYFSYNREEIIRRSNYIYHEFLIPIKRAITDFLIVSKRDQYSL